MIISSILFIFYHPLSTFSHAHFCPIPPSPPLSLYFFALNFPAFFCLYFFLFDTFLPSSVFIFLSILSLPPSLFIFLPHTLSPSVSFCLQHFAALSPDLRVQIEEEELQSYLADFEAGVKDEVVLLGSISLEEVQEEERRLRDEHVKYLGQEAERERNREERLLAREEAARARLAQLLREKREFLERREVGGTICVK